jgi:hypothetical protein
MVYIVGMFGWTGTPFAFDVVTKSLRRAIRKIISGSLEMYVDDLMGCSLISQTDNDIQLAGDECRSLAGPEAMAEEKTEKGRILIFLGWEINLDTKMVTTVFRRRIC